MADPETPALIEVLLATYNGERFLREQIESILGQDYGNVRILARDDGSTDQTTQILAEYAAHHPDRFRVLSTETATGTASGNFLHLMEASTANYICFADQDDIWLTQKLSQTMHAMRQLESQWGMAEPLLVFTDLRVVDDQLRTLHNSFWAHEKIDPDRIHRLAPLLVQNVVTGCTAMLNRPLLKLSSGMPAEAMMHDHWIALLSCTLGHAAAVKTQTILYRQHDRNVVGSGKGTQTLQDLGRRVRPSQARETRWEQSQRQAEALLRLHGASLSPASRDLLQKYTPRGSTRTRTIRILSMLRHGFWQVGFKRNVAMVFDLWTMNPR